MPKKGTPEYTIWLEKFQQKKAQGPTVKKEETSSDINQEARKYKGFRFKQDKPTGRYASFYPTTNYIKIGNSSVGIFGKEGVRLMVKKAKTIEDPAPFEWITLKKQGSEKELKEWLSQPATYKSILSRYDLYYID